MSNLTPDEFRALYHEGTDCFESGNYVKAEALLKEVIRNNPNLADIHNKLGVIANLEDNLDEAIGYFKKAVELNSSYTEASLNLAITLNEQGKVDEATEIFSSINDTIKESPAGLDPFAAGKIANEHFNLGNLYQEFGMSQESVEEYRKALKLRPMTDVMVKLGVALRDLGDKDAAVVEFEAARKENPKYTPALTQLGLAYYLMDRYEDAYALWEEALLIDPELKEPKGYLKMFRKEG